MGIASVGLVARGQVKVGELVFAYELEANGCYRLTGHKVELVTVATSDGRFSLRATKGSVRKEPRVPGPGGGERPARHGALSTEGEMETMNERATAIMCAAGQAWAAQHGERHTYSEIIFGLEAVLASVGMTASAAGGEGRAAESVAWSLSHLLHDPLCSIDPDRFTVAQIARAIENTLHRDYSRTTYEGFEYRSWQRPEEPVDFHSLAGEIAQALKGRKIRKGTKRAAAFYAEQRAHVLPQVRKLVADGIARLKTKGAADAARIRKELPDVERDIGRHEFILAVCKGLRAAAGAPDLGSKDHETAGAAMALVEEHLGKRKAKRETIEARAAEEEGRADGFDAEEVLRVGMQAHPELAPFLEPVIHAQGHLAV